MLKIRPLCADDYDAVRKAFAEDGCDEALAQNVIGGLSIFNDTTNECVGFWGLRQFINAGPLWIDPKYRGAGLSHVLGEGMKVLAKSNGVGFASITDKPHTKHIFEKLEFTRVGELYVIKGTD